MVLAANIVADSEEDEGETIDFIAAMVDLPSLLVQHVLSSKAEHEDEENHQCKNLFHMFLIVRDCCVLTIIDSESCSNLVSSDLVKKLGLTTHSIPHPYHLEWFNNCGKTKVTKSARIHFSVGSYHDYADFDVVHVQSSSLLLG